MLCWDRLAPEAREAMRLAHGEAERLGHAHVGGEHVLLGLLAYAEGPAAGGCPAARPLTDHGLDLGTARTEVSRIVAETTRPDGAAALRSLGIDVAEVRRQLEASFGATAVHEATWQVARRPWWRGGGKANPLWRRPVLYKRAIDIAAHQARRRGKALVSAEHLLYGVLHDARDPLLTGMRRRGRTKIIAQTGLRESTPHPVRLLLDAHGVDIEGLILGREPPPSDA